MLTAFASLLGFVAVALGAFGAHGLADRLDAQALGWWQTGTTYLMVHAVAAFAVALSGRPGLFAWGGWALALGSLVFAGTLYAMALGAPRWLGAVTPLGGLGMLIGWAMIGWGALRLS